MQDTRQLSPRAQKAMAAIFVLAGVAIMALAAGIIPADERSFEAPHWVVGAAGLLFALGGLLIITTERFARLRDFLGALLLSSLASVAGWVAFGPGPRAFSSSFSFGGVTSSAPSGETGGRIAFGIAAVLIGVWALAVWYKWLRELSRKN